MLSNEIVKLRSNNACNSVLPQEYVQNLINEDKSLKRDNDGLKEPYENILFPTVALKPNIDELKVEEKSLLIKLLQTDADLLKPVKMMAGQQLNGVQQKKT